MRCQNCSAENSEGAKFCIHCATPLNKRCAKCGSDNTAQAKFCSQCAHPLGALAATPSTERHEEIKGERRHLTVLFCDLVNSTEIAASLDPEEWHEVAGQYQAVASEAVTRFGGHVDKYLGDGLVVYFGYPRAHEDDPERAVRSGLAILDDIAKLNERLAVSKRPRLATRVGIHSGAVVIGAGGGKESEVFGDTPNIASRVQALAAPDTVLITTAAYRLVSGLFVVEELGAHQLKGIAEPMDLYRVVQASGMRGRLAVSAGRGHTPLVGREDEERLLWSRWERAREGEGQVVLITGEAGIGKSRLVQGLHERLAGTQHTWVECASAPYFQKTAFYSIIDMLQQGFALRGDESAEEKLSRLESNLKLAGMKLDEAVPLIAPLLNVAVSSKYPPLSLSPEQQRKRLLATLAAWTFGAAKAQPLVIVLEDLHWVDPSTLELTQLLVEQGATAPLLLLYTARPEFRPQWPARAHHTQLMLNRLSNSQSHKMVARVAARVALGRDVLATLVERAGGVPLFIEELTRLMLESSGVPDAQEIPATLQDSLMARLDGLGPAKEVAQIASVIGRDFSYEMIRAVASAAEPDLQSALAKLCDAELLYVRGIPPEATYTFKHALIQDAAYESLLKSRRRELHRAVAKTIDAEFGSVADEKPEMLARHWAGAGESERAIAAWQKAGEQARGRGAFVEAEGAYRQALLILNTLPESPERDVRELALMSPFVPVLAVTKAYGAPEMVEATVRARWLAEKSGNVAELLRQVFAAWTSAQAAGDYRVGGALADQLLDLAKSEQGPGHLGLAYMAQVSTRFYSGDLAGSEEYFARGRGFFEAPGFRQYPGAVANLFGSASWCAWIIGRPDAARERGRRAFSAANENHNPYDLAFAQWKIADLHLYLREPEQAQTLAAEAVRLSDEHHFPFLAALSRAVLGRAQAQLGRPEQGTVLIREGLAGVAKVGTRLGICRYLTYLAEAQALNGDTGGALATVEESLQANPAELVERPQTLRCRGQLHYKQNRADLAEADFREAITLAHAMGAKALELRSAMNLARLLANANRRDEARGILAEIYGWFTEGVDTADLKEAKALLAELSE